MKPLDLQEISNKYVAGFLQKAIIKQVQREDEVLHAFDPRPELPKYEKPKKVALTAGIYNFVKYNVLQLMP